MHRIYTPAALVRRNALLLILSVAITFSILRILLYQSPDSDFNVGRYNVHHLFMGLLLITAGGVPLAVFRGSTRRLDMALVVFGIGLGMALDEWVYLIATDGSNASYLLPVSFWGGVVAVGLACAYAAGLAIGRR
jgi:short subunit fatty acids transporter